MARARRPRNLRNATSKTASPGSLGEVLDNAGFTPLGRRIVVGGPKLGDEKRRSTTVPQLEASGGRLERQSAPTWTAPVIVFLADNLPGDPSVAWDHLFITAYEVGCEALAALGQATQILGGAIPLADPEIPDFLPRWDDVATAVVWVAAQSNLSVTVISPVHEGSQVRRGAPGQTSVPRTVAVQLTWHPKRSALFEVWG